MKFRTMAWNIRQASAERSKRIAAAVAEIDPDVAFFTEWAPSPNRGSRVLAAELAAHGFDHEASIHHSNLAPRQGQAWHEAWWGVLAVSKTPIHRVEANYLWYTPSGWLQVHHDASGAELVGVRMPAWEPFEGHKRRECWEWMIDEFDRLVSSPTVVLGDFNTLPTYPTKLKTKRYGGDLLASLTSERGWVDPFEVCGADKTATFWRNNGVAACVDHAFVSPPLAGGVRSASAPKTIGDHLLYGPAKREDGSPSGRLSDHVPVIVDLDLSQTTAQPRLADGTTNGTPEGRR